jgi:hypothetical protein
MPTRWKLREFLEAHNITPYRLAQETAGQLGMKSIYNLVKEPPPDRLRIRTFDVLIPALERLTGEAVQVSDLLDYERAQK